LTFVVFLTVESVKRPVFVSKRTKKGILAVFSPQKREKTEFCTFLLVLGGFAAGNST